jgi:hypothetical protein
MKVGQPWATVAGSWVAPGQPPLQIENTMAAVEAPSVDAVSQPQKPKKRGGRKFKNAKGKPKPQLASESILILKTGNKKTFNSIYKILYFK